MSREKIDYRVMGDYSIAKSYKGILRIAHVMEKMENEKDIFNNNVYYGSPSSLMNISGNSSTKGYGFPNASAVFEGRVERYLSEKDYLDKKLPVTDSMGNYINWNLGTDDSTIGSDMENNGFSLGIDEDKEDRYFYQSGFDKKILQPFVFPVLESKEIVVGLESKLIPNEKRYFSSEGILNIRDDEKTPMIVISNIYDNSETNRVYKWVKENDEDVEKVESEVEYPTYVFSKAKYNGNENVKYRTIIKNSKNKVEEYDAFTYCQENYNRKNFIYNHKIGNDEIDYNKDQGDILPETHIDAEVDLVNLKDYVKDIIKKYMKSNVVEVPTATIIHQYISPEKWYAKSDSGSGNEINDENFVGHRPCMEQRNFQSNAKNDANSSSSRWNSSTLQGASLKINRLNIGEDVSPKERGEDDEYDSAFESNKLQEVIPLYKRDYLLCDGSLYHMFLIEYNNTRNEIQRKNLTIDRFFDLFFTIGYDYTLTSFSDVNPFSDIKKRYKSKLITSNDGQQRIKFVNTYNNPIDETNYMYYEGNKDETKDAITQIMQWSDEGLSSLRDCETLHGIDVASILAYKILMEEDNKDIESAFIGDDVLHYNRNKAEEWLKKQPIPQKYVFNTFIGDTEESFMSYPATDAALEQIKKHEKHVMCVPYKHKPSLTVENKDKWAKVNIGREVNTFSSLIKYFIPGINEGETGQYIICELWQIPEIQYMLDVMIAGSGERNQLFPNMFNFTFRVPNLTDSIYPKFVGSTGFNWRDQNETMLNGEMSWYSTMSSGTYSHRHAVFKGMLSGFSDNEQQEHFQGKILGGYGDVASASVNFHRDVTNFPQGGKNGGAGQFVSDYTGSYLWNELGTNEGVVLMDREDRTSLSDYTILPENILQRSDYIDKESYPDYYSGEDRGGLKGYTGFDKSLVIPTDVLDIPQNKPLLDYIDNYLEHVENISSLDDALKNTSTRVRLNGAGEGPNGTMFQKTGSFRGSYEDLINFPENEETSDFTTYINWYNTESMKWYSFLMDEDPRFDNMEPNRCITAPPVSYRCPGTASYTKNSWNKEANVNGSCYYFAPENIKALPLIKL